VRHVIAGQGGGRREMAGDGRGRPRIAEDGRGLPGTVAICARYSDEEVD